MGTGRTGVEDGRAEEVEYRHSDGCLCCHCELVNVNVIYISDLGERRGKVGLSVLILVSTLMSGLIGDYISATLLFSSADESKTDPDDAKALYADKSAGSRSGM